MAHRVVRLIGFYAGNFINQDVLITDDADDNIAVQLIKVNFRGAIIGIMKQQTTKGAKQNGKNANRNQC